jgi:hypothetical protein
MDLQNNRSGQQLIRENSRPNRRDYQVAVADRMLSLAMEKGRRPSHQITIGFRHKSAPIRDAAVIKLLNDRDRADVARLSRNLPRYLMRTFLSTNRGPQRSYYHAIVPECRDASGADVRWHFHIQLFFTWREINRLRPYRGKIEQRLLKYFQEYAGNREVHIESTTTDEGFLEYCHKDAINELSSISNLIDHRRK